MFEHGNFRNHQFNFTNIVFDKVAVYWSRFQAIKLNTIRKNVTLMKLGQAFSNNIFKIIYLYLDKLGDYFDFNIKPLTGQ